MNAIDTILSRFGYTKKSSLIWLNKATPQNKEEQVIKLIEHTRLLYKIDIGHWRSAHQIALDGYRPRRDLLMDVYQDALLDTHVKTVFEARTLSVLNIPFEVVDETTNEIDAELTRLLTKRWLFKYLKAVLESIFYGYTVTRLKLKQGIIDDIETIPRWNVVPGWHAIIPDLNTEEIVRFDAPPYNNLYTLLGSDPKDMGLLLQIARFAIFKKHSISHWGKYQQLFGIPMRIAKTNTRDKDTRKKIEENLKRMGAAMYAIMPLGTEIELKESASKDGVSVFDTGIDRANKEISKVALGQTMTTESGSSRSQSEVHQEEKGELTRADMRFTEFEINDKFFPQLMRWGVPLQGKRWRFNASRSLPIANNQLEIDRWLGGLFELNPDYIRETYGTIIGERINVGSNNNPKTEENETKNRLPLPPSASITAQVAHAYDIGKCACAKNNLFENSKDISKNLQEIITKVVQKVYRKELKVGEIDQALFEEIAAILWTDTQKGYGATLLDLDLDSEDYHMLAALQENIYTFTVFKSHHNISAIAELLIDPVTGKLRPENEFLAEAAKINNQYYKAWLRTERNTVIASSQSAARWQEWQADKETLPNVKFQTIGDDRVRSSHKKLKGVVLAISDPLLKTYNTPLDYNCRCEWVQTNEEEKPPKELPKVPMLFQNNPGETGEIFTEDHPFWAAIPAKKKQEYQKIVETLIQKQNRQTKK